MKKMLLSAALIMAALSANAQGELCVFNGSSLGLNADAVTPVAAGTEIASTASVKATIKFDDSYKLVNMKEGSFIINGEEVSIPEGSAIQGNGNGKGDCATSTNFAAQGGAGCVYEFAPTQTGYLYLMISASANKQYVVYENELSRMPYIYASEDVTDADPSLTVFAYDMMNLEGATYFDEAVKDYYVTEDYAIGKVSVIVTGTETKSDGNGILKFKAYAGQTYQAMATGSKMSIGGFYFDTTGDATITTTNGNTLLEAGQVPGNGGGTGIAGVEVKDEVDANAPVYNIAGQRVNKNAKGLVIVNGKKVLRK